MASIEIFRCGMDQAFFARPLNDSVYSYLHCFTSSQRCHAMAKDFLLEYDPKTEVRVGKFKGARGQLAVMGRVTASRGQLVQRSIAKEGLLHLRASCGGKGFVERAKAALEG